MNHAASYLAVLVVLAALAGGCAVDQQQEIAVYRQVLDVPSVDTQAPDPLSLRQALALANRFNERLDLQGEAYLQAIIERRQVAANFLPTVDLLGGYALKDSATNGTSDQTSLRAELDVNLFRGLRDAHRYARQNRLIEQRRDELLAAQEALLLDTAAAYYQALRGEALVRVLESSARVQAERLADTQVRLEVGVARPLDLAQMQAQLSATRSRLLDARRDARNARWLLALLTSAPVAATALSDEYDPPPIDPPMEDWLAAAGGQRRELSAAAAAVEAARHEVQTAFGQYYPSVSLNLGALLYASPSDPVDWDAALVARVPLFAAGRIHADVRMAWSFLRQAVLFESQAQRQVHEQVRRAWTDLDSSRQRLEELRVQLSAAEQAFEQADRSYLVGLATNLDRIVAQDALLAAQLQLTSEAYDLKLRHLALLRAAGALRAQVLEGQGSGLPLGATIPGH